MAQRDVSINKKQFFLRIILPSALTIVIFIVFNFGFIIPYFEVNQMNNKKQMIREIVFSSICIADELNTEVGRGLISLSEAQEKAALSIGSMRYGVENKDYLWITDLHPTMVRHPYRSELNGQDLSDFSDAHGKKMFVEFVEQSRKTGEAYVNYMWQWMDDSTRIVPKISFVMEYRPWGWLIGTGVYLEDIRNEIAGMKRIFTFASLAIFAVMTALLTIIVRRNLRVETQRSIAEQNLNESRERYRALVEASTDGTLLYLDGKFIYANKKVKDMLSGIDLGNLNSDLCELIHPARKDDIALIKEFQHTQLNHLQMETLLAIPGYEDREVLLTISEVTFSDKSGFIYVFKELVKPKAVETESALAQLAPSMSESLSMGIFSATFRGKGRFITFSPGLPKLLGFRSVDELSKVSIIDLIDNHTERREFVNYLAKYRKLDGYQLNFRKPDGSYINLLIYATFISDELTGTERISGIFIDGTQVWKQKKTEKSMAAEVAVFRSFLNSAVHHFMQAPVFCSPESKIPEIISLMRFYNSPVIFVRKPDGMIAGSITSDEVMTAISGENFLMELTAAQLMNPVSVWVSKNITLIEAINLLVDKKAIFLLAGNKTGVPDGIVTKESMTAIMAKALPGYLKDESETAIFANLVEHCRKLPSEVKILLDNGTRPQVITNLVTSRSDEVTRIFAEKVLEEMGPAPAMFALIALGSEARKEQTLLSDQDNALIYDDQVAGNPQAANYFLRFGKRMNELLHQAGYELCKGDIMAGNPRWNQPLSTWKKYFASWIKEANPQNIIDISVFFDYRTIFGHADIIDELRDAIHTMLDGNPAFFSYMALANLNYKIPLNVFGRLQPETSDDNSGTINIKNATRVIVNIIRLYSVKNRLEETNTLGRIEKLYSLNVLPQHLYTDISYAWEFLLVMQFRHQVFAYINRLQIDHNINLSMLSSIEINTLKIIFTSLTSFQNRLKNDFGVNI